MIVINEVTKKLESKFVCLKCKDTFYKILRINNQINSIPFLVEKDEMTYHRNLQTPYFECGSITGPPIPKCEFYFDIYAGIFNFQKI